MIRLLIGLLLALALSLPATAAPDVAAYSRTAEAGGVTVKVVYAPPEYFQAARDPAGARRFRPEEQIVFLVTLDTHAGDLMRFDVLPNSRLRTRGGTPREYPPAKWEATSDASHHRSGALIFPATVNGMKVLGSGVTTMTLVISNLAGVPARSLEWVLPVR
jgi:hypothetical protein